MSSNKKKFLKSLDTLMRVEGANIKNIQQEIFNITNQLNSMSDQVKSIDDTIEKEKNFVASGCMVHCNIALFLKRMEIKKTQLSKQKKVLDEQWLKVHEELMSHVRNQKSYEAVHTKTATMQKAEEDRKEKVLLEDLMQIRFIQNNRKHQESEDKRI